MTRRGHGLWIISVLRAVVVDQYKSDLQAIFARYIDCFRVNLTEEREALFRRQLQQLYS